MNTNPKFAWLFCFIPVAASWMFDLPQILAIPLKESYGLQESQVLFMYSIYSIPNLIFVFIGGFIVNKYGSIVFLACLLIALFGNSIFAIGIATNSYWSMLIGRLFVGMGSETGITASYYILTNYWRSDSLRFYNALIYIICQATTMVNLFLTPKIWLDTHSQFWPIVLSEMASVISIICFGFFWRLNPQVHSPVFIKDTDEETISELEKKTEDLSLTEKLSFSKFNLEPTTSSESYNSEQQDVVEIPKSGRVSFVRDKNDPSFMTCQLDDLNQDSLTIPSESNTHSENSQIIYDQPIQIDQKTTANFILKEKKLDPINAVNISDKNKKDNKAKKGTKNVFMKLKALLSKINISYVYLMVFNMTTASTYISCISFQTVFLTVFFKMDYEIAKNVGIAQPFFFILVIICWLFVSKYVNNDGSVLLFSSTLMTLNQIKTYVFTQPSEAMAFIHVILHGISGALYQSVFYVAVSKNLPKNYEGIAIAIMCLNNNLMNALCPLITGYLIGPQMTKVNSLDAIFFQIFLSQIGVLASLFYYIRENARINSIYCFVKKEESGNDDYLMQNHNKYYVENNTISEEESSTDWSAYRDSDMLINIKKT